MTLERLWNVVNGDGLIVTRGKTVEGRVDGRATIRAPGDTQSASQSSWANPAASRPELMIELSSEGCRISNLGRCDCALGDRSLSTGLARRTHWARQIAGAPRRTLYPNQLGELVAREVSPQPASPDSAYDASRRARAPASAERALVPLHPDSWPRAPRRILLPWGCRAQGWSRSAGKRPRLVVSYWSITTWKRSAPLTSCRSARRTGRSPSPCRQGGR